MLSHMPTHDPIIVTRGTPFWHSENIVGRNMKVLYRNRSNETSAALILYFTQKTIRLLQEYLFFLELSLLYSF